MMIHKQRPKKEKMKKKTGEQKKGCIFMNDFNKKWLTITGGLAISGGLLVLIMNQFQAEKQDDVWLDVNSQQNTELSVSNPEGFEDDEETGSNLIVPSISVGETAETTTIPPIILTDTSGNTLDSHPDPNVIIPEAGTMNGDDKGTSQTIQPDVSSKPTYSQSQMTDPTQTPDGGNVIVTESGEILAEKEEEIPPEPVITSPTVTEPEINSTQTTTNPTTSTPATSTPTTSTGTTTTPPAPTDQQVSDTQVYFPGFGWIESSGPNVGVQLTDMYENGNKVGNM